MKLTAGMAILGVALLSMTASGQVGGKSKADVRLRNALSDASLTFTETSSGNFKLLFNIGNGRTHQVIAESATQTMGVVEVREVWATGWKGKKEPSAYIANKMLRDNARKKVGAWELYDDDQGGYFAIFNVKVSADCDGEALKVIIRGIAQTADEMEDELLHTDKF